MKHKIQIKVKKLPALTGMPDTEVFIVYVNRVWLYSFGSKCVADMVAARLKTALTSADTEVGIEYV